MNEVDWVILAILGLSVLIGLWRGLIAELLSLVVWVAAFWVAATYGADVAAQLSHVITLPMARIGLGYAICFTGVLILGAVVRFAVRRLLWSSGLSGIDRLFGMVFGFVRGVLLVTLLVFLVGLTGVTREIWWQHSVLLPQFQGTAAWLGQNVPASVRDHLHPEAVLDKIHPSQVLDHLPNLTDKLHDLPNLPNQLRVPTFGVPAAPAASRTTMPAPAASAAGHPTNP
ncbi:CvpA family protein [Rhodanobacter sp. Col0626]|uniref:CvpA family protein n=1 Tax=Rhodanobacter sp. Col0626 TaxID=3415679 RepID=UPI003CF042E5